MSEERHLTSLDLDVLQASNTSDTSSHLAGCPACQARQALRHEEAEAFNRLRLPRLLSRWSEQGASQPRRAWLWLAAGASLATVLVLAVTRFPTRSATVGAEEDVGIKGWQPGLRAVVRRGNQVFEAREGDRLWPGDAVRFVVATPPPGNHLLVASVDGAGQVSIYFPFQGEGSVPVVTQRPLEVPPQGSIVLDQAPGPERVFGFFSAQPLTSEPVRRLLEALGRRGPEAIRRETRLELPGTLQMSFFFEKAERQR